MKTTTIEMVLDALIEILKVEGIDIDSINFNLQGGKNTIPVPFTKLIDLARKDLADIPQDSLRLDFILENRIRVEKWNTNPSTEFYFVMNEDDESIAKELNGRDAVDAAIKYFEEETNDQN